MSVYNVLYLLLVFSFALSASAMWVNWLLNRHELAVRDWAIALSLILLGCSLAILARLQLPGPDAMIPLTFASFLRDLGTAINGLAWIVVWCGILRFMGRPTPKKRSLFIVWCGFFALLLSAHPLGLPGAWNVAWISALVSITSLLILYEILRPGIGGVATWFACAGFALAAITWGVRATMSFLDIQRTIDSGFDVAVIFGAVISAYACMMGLILLTNQRLIDRMGTIANRDTLTMVLNRRGFFDSVEPLIQRAEQSGDKYSIVLLDMDNLQDINETHGQESGDRALKQVAVSSMQVLGRQDLFARYTGDEFIFFLYGKSGAQTRMAMNRLQIVMQQNIIESEKSEFRIHLSMGIAELSPPESLETVIGNAYLALRSAKLKGGSRVDVYDAQLGLMQSGS